MKKFMLTYRAFVEADNMEDAAKAVIDSIREDGEAIFEIQEEDCSEIYEVSVGVKTIIYKIK